MGKALEIQQGSFNAPIKENVTVVMKRPRDGARNRSSAPPLAVARNACPLEHREHSRNELLRGASL